MALPPCLHRALATLARRRETTASALVEAAVADLLCGSGVTSKRHRAANRVTKGDRAMTAKERQRAKESAGKKLDAARKKMNDAFTEAEDALSKLAAIQRDEQAEAKALAEK